MVNETDEKLYRFVIGKYGTEAQTDMVIEECSELIKALLKYRRAPNDDTLANIREELTDVQIVWEQAVLMYGLNPEDRPAKLQRLANNVGYAE